MRPFNYGVMGFLLAGVIVNGLFIWAAYFSHTEPPLCRVWRTHQT